MTAPALPPEVERAIGQFAYAVRREAQEPGEPSTTYATEQAAALRTAIARALGGDGEPVAASVDAALAALDVEENLHPDRMEVTHTILGLDAVRAAHRAEVERAIAALSARVAKLEAALRFYADDANYRFQNDADGSLRSPAVNEDHGAEARAALEDKP